MSWNLSTELPAGITARYCAELAMTRLQELGLADPTAIMYHRLGEDGMPDSYDVECSAYIDYEWYHVETYTFHEVGPDSVMWVERGSCRVPASADKAISDVVSELCYIGQ